MELLKKKQLPSESIRPTASHVGCLIGQDLLMAWDEPSSRAPGAWMKCGGLGSSRPSQHWLAFCFPKILFQWEFARVALINLFHSSYVKTKIPQMGLPNLIVFQQDEFVCWTADSRAMKVLKNCVSHWHNVDRKQLLKSCTWKGCFLFRKRKETGEEPI